MKKYTVFLAAASLAFAAHARVTRIVIDEVKPMPVVAGQMVYEQIAGRAFGELDPKRATNAIIQDIQLGLDKDGKARYVATFLIAKPVDTLSAKGMLWHDVPNRGRNLSSLSDNERKAGDVLLASAWQGDNAGQTAVKDKHSISGLHWLQLPVAKNLDGSAITGEVMGRIVNRSGKNSQALLVQTNPLPYKPFSLDTSKARLTERTGELQNGTVLGEKEILPSDWSWGKCDEQTPFPGTPDATQICLKNGFDPLKLYQVTFTAVNPYVLGMGFAAWRDVGAFFKSQAKDDVGTANPLFANGKAVITHSIGRGISQSGNYLRGWLHLGFNQDESGKSGAMVHDGLWPIIAGRRIALNFRWAQPDGVLELYQAGSEGPQWWLPHPDPVRDPQGTPLGILSRCLANQTCPKVVEHFGSAEVWALKLTPEWVGADAKQDLALPSNVRRYYIASSTHGGGAGGFNTSIPASAGGTLPATGPAMCPGNNFGAAVLPVNPVPHLQTVNAIQYHFREWVMRGTPAPASRYPTLVAGQLGTASKAGIGFPDLPSLRKTLPEPDFIMPVHDYDWGPHFNHRDGSGIPAYGVPKIKNVLTMLAPKVDADGNELGGVPVVLLDAPLGTYLGWNITTNGFHKDQICNYVGGMIPFARSKDEREKARDPRLSLEERYGDKAGYITAVQKAADRALAAGFLLEDDARLLVQQARDSVVLK